jgi:hypothetical protein
VGYVRNPARLQVQPGPRPKNPGLPAQEDIDVTLPCQSTPAAQNLDGSCGGGTFNAGAAPSFQFTVPSPEQGIWNGGITATYTGTNVAGVGAANVGAMQLQYLDEGQWQTVAYHYRQGGGGTNPGSAGADAYAPTGQVVTVDDPKPGEYRIYFANAAALPGRLKVDFRHATAEDNPGQKPINASSMDFFEELGGYVPQGSDLDEVSVQRVLNDPASLSSLDSLVLVNDLGSRGYLTEELGLTNAQASTFFANLKAFATGGGNLVLTDGGVQALAEMGVVPPESVLRIESNSETTAGNYAFQINNGNITYNDAEKYPLAEGVKVPGAAEQQPGRRQAVEPAPLGYSPDYGLDGTPKLPNWGVDRAVWEGMCGKPDCVTATTLVNGNIVNLGEADLGQGTVRIGGILLPNPMYEPDERNDHRFGVADYALTYTAWQVFENLIDYQR